MEQGHIHTESLRSRPVEVSVSATPPPYPQQEHRDTIGDKGVTTYHQSLP